MPSFQLYQVREEFNIKDLEDKNVLSQIEAKDEDPRTLKEFIKSGKKSHRNLIFDPLDEIDAVIMRFDEKLDFQDKQFLWVNSEKLIIKHKNLLLIGKTSKKIEKLIQIYLHDYAKSKPIFFKDKQLWQIWKKLISITSNNLEYKLHRIIIKNTYLEAEKVSELNIHAKNVGNLAIIREIVDQAEKINAITIKVNGLYSKNKMITIRIDKNGSILFYGKHETSIIQDFLSIFIKAF
jgi:hypothetical protein